MRLVKALLVDLYANPGRADRRTFLYQFPFRVGRESRNAKRLAQEGIEGRLKSIPTNDLYIYDPGPSFHVSREHFEIDVRDGDFYVVDRGSTLGTMVNDERIGGNKQSGCIKLERKENLILVGGERSPFRFKLILYPLKAKILVADDDPNAVKILSDFLRLQGHEITCADDGLEAVRKMVGERPDLILLDWMMPHIEGIEICRQVKSNPITSHVPIIILTGRIYPEDKVTGFEAGADDFVTKPFDIRELDMRVKRLLSRSLRSRTICSESGLPNSQVFFEEVDARLLDEELAEAVSVVLVEIQGLGVYQAEHGRAEAEKLLSDIWRLLGALPVHVGASESMVGHLARNVLGILTSEEWVVELEDRLRSDLVSNYPQVRFDIRSVSNQAKRYVNFWQMLESEPVEAEGKSSRLLAWLT